MHIADDAVGWYLQNWSGSSTRAFWKDAKCTQDPRSSFSLEERQAGRHVETVPLKEPFSGNPGGPFFERHRSQKAVKVVSEYLAHGNLKSYVVAFLDWGSAEQNFHVVHSWDRCLHHHPRAWTACLSV